MVLKSVLGTDWASTFGVRGACCCVDELAADLDRWALVDCYRLRREDVEVPRPSTVWAVNKAGKELMDMSAPPDDAFREVVQQLMDAGWYRVGQEGRPSGVYWQFRQGHTLDAGAENDRRIPAPDEKAAMRILWNEVRNERIVEKL
jgi:hypothetical protein